MTKPFQSFRQLMGRVLGRQPNGQDNPAFATLGLESVGPNPRSSEHGEENLQAEIEVQTADTQRLPQVNPEFLAGRNGDKDRVAHDEVVDEFGDSLLDLDDVQSAPGSSAYELVLDLDFETVPHIDESLFVEPAPRTPDAELSMDDSEVPALTEPEGLSVVEVVSADVVEAQEVAEKAAGASMENQMHFSDSSPEAIDAIARRVVEHLSEKVVKEIAWEVVPELAELMIKQKLEQTQR